MEQSPSSNTDSVSALQKFSTPSIYVTKISSCVLRQRSQTLSLPFPTLSKHKNLHVEHVYKQQIAHRQNTKHCYMFLLLSTAIFSTEELEAPNCCLCIQSNSAGFSFINTGKQVHLKHARRHFERNLVKDVYHRSVASRNWLKS